LDGRPTDQPDVLAWMPAAAVYFRDPDDNLLEFIHMLPDTPRPELGVLPWTDWIYQSSVAHPPFSIEPFRDRRSELLPLFELADDSQTEITHYMECGEMLVARREQRTIGLIQLLSQGADHEIKSLAVMKSEQRRGVGTALVRAALDRAFSSGALRVRVATATSDIHNLSFYQRLGFRMDSVEHDAFTIARGYRSGTVNGIPVRDRVWLSIHTSEVRRGETVFSDSSFRDRR
jgi:ribosomal protein S18 acetylase RimI-like enzyme